MIGVTNTIFILPVILLLSHSIHVHSFAISSSSSPKRKKVTNQGKSAGGFAKKDDGKYCMRYVYLHNYAILHQFPHQKLLQQHIQEMNQYQHQILSTFYYNGSRKGWD